MSDLRHPFATAPVLAASVALLSLGLWGCPQTEIAYPACMCTAKDCVDDF